MNEKEICNRIEVCKKRINGYLEVSNTRMVNKYENEISKWERLLDCLSLSKSDRIKQLQDFEKGYYTLLNRIDIAIERLEGLCRTGAIDVKSKSLISNALNGCYGETSIMKRAIDNLDNSSMKIPTKFETFYVPSELMSKTDLMFKSSLDSLANAELTILENFLENSSNEKKGS